MCRQTVTRKRAALFKDIKMQPMLVKYLLQPETNGEFQNHLGLVMLCAINVITKNSFTKAWCTCANKI